MNQPEIAAPPVLLRPWRTADGYAAAAAWADPEIRRWARYGATLPDRDTVAGWVLWNHEQWAARRRAGFAIEAPDGGLAGSIAVKDFEKDERGGGGDTAEIGYWITPAWRGRGIAPLAVGAVARWLFSPEEAGGLGVRRVQLLHSVRNAASCRVAQKAGFLREGTLRESFRYADGDWHDEHLHARLAGDRVGPPPPPGGKPAEL